MIFIRRVIIAIFAVSINDVTTKFFFIIILSFFLLLQGICNPFIIHEANEMESILMVCLIITAVAQTIISLVDLLFINIVLSFLILLPFLLLAYYVYRVYYKFFEINKEGKIGQDGQSIVEVEHVLSDTDCEYQQNIEKDPELRTNDMLGTQIELQQKKEEHHISKMSSSGDIISAFVIGSVNNDHALNIDSVINDTLNDKD